MIISQKNISVVDIRNILQRIFSKKSVHSNSTLDIILLWNCRLITTGLSNGVAPNRCKQFPEWATDEKGR